MTWKTGHIWAYPPKSNTQLGSSGPTRVDTSNPDPDFKPRPVGFTAVIEPLEVEPLTWEGDGA